MDRQPSRANRLTLCLHHGSIPKLQSRACRGAAKRGAPTTQPEPLTRENGQNELETALSSPAVGKSLHPPTLQQPCQRRLHVLTAVTKRVTIFKGIREEKNMAETITAVYEKGVLRPLTPLALPESSRVEIQIMGQAADPQDERQQVRQALRDAGLVRPQPATQPVKAVSETELAAAAASLAQAGPLSQLIIDERNGR